MVWEAYADYPGEDIVAAGIRVEANVSQTTLLPGCPGSAGNGQPPDFVSEYGLLL
jgi:hypothetical protein